MDTDAMEHFDLSRYWNDERLAGHALRALDVPLSYSFADAERAFSK